MTGRIDLHCHYLPAVDDGVRTFEEGIALLEALAAEGFEEVVATPHLRPGLFDNEPGALREAFTRFHDAAERRGGALPRLSLASEHYFDEVNFGRLVRGAGLPFRGERAALLEFYEIDFPPSIDRQFFELQRRGLLPVIAHPERYRCLWDGTEALERLVDRGAAALLDVAALVGKYGRRPQRAAEKLLERGLYHAACSDAHRPSDVEAVASGIRLVAERFGDEEVDFLFSEGPRALLAGRLPG